MYNRKIIAIILIISLLSGLGIATMIGVGNTYDKTEYTNTSIMSAEGDFDKVKLTDRHFGDLNGLEVEGNLLSLLLVDDSNATISIDHYEVGVFGNRYIEDNTYLFYLYVYQGNDDTLLPTCCSNLGS